MNITIIGAGIGGLAAAFALQNAGFKVNLYERAAELREVGAGISLWSNATAVLEKFGLLEKAIAESCVINGLRVRDSRGTLLMQTNIDKYATPSICIHRSNLINLLAGKCAPNSIHTARTFERFEQTENSVTAFFDNGESIESDILIGADGINSRVRAQMKGDSKPIYRGYVVWRGIVNSLSNLETANFAAESWGAGNRFGLLPIGNNRFYWYATNNQKENLSLVINERKKVIVDIFKDWHNPIPRVVEATNAVDILQNDCQNREPEKGWSQNRVCLIGDAAHSTTPNMGQGGCLALEDAVVLTKKVRNTSTPQTAFQEFEQARYERAKLINKRSLFFGRVGQLENSFLVKARNLLTKNTPSRIVEKSFEEVYSYQA